MVLASPADDAAEPTQLPGGAARILHVNTNYVNLHPEIKRVVGSDDVPRGAYQVLVPASRKQHAKAISASIADANASEARRTGVAVARMTSRVVPDMTWPLYPDQADLITESSMTSPVVVLVGADLQPVSDDDVVSAVTQSRLMFTSAEAGRHWVRRERLSLYVVSVVDAQEAAQQAASTAAVELRRQLVALGLGAAVLVLTAITLAVLLAQSRSQRLFVEWVHGWTWIGRHGVVVAVTAAAVVVVTLAWVAAIAPDQSAGPLPPGDADRAAVRTRAAVASIALSIVTFITSLAVVSARTDHQGGTPA